MPKAEEPAPDYVPEEFAKEWEQIYKSVYAREMEGKSADDEDAKKKAEQSAFEQANGVIKKRKENASEVAAMSDRDYALLDGKKVYKKDFGYAPAGTGPSEWKFRLDDEDHVRDAMSRFNQEKGIPHDAMRHLYHMILERAHKYGMDTSNFEKKHGGAFKGSDEPRFVWPLSSAFVQGKRIPIAITGTWARGGRKFSITLDHLKRMVANFAKRKNGEVNLDYDHACETLERAADGTIPSAGRVVALEDPEPTGSGRHILWGLCEPTDRATERVRNREYRYISPAINFHGEDKETGDDQGATLTSVAFTNRPFLEEMPQVQLSDPNYQLVDVGSVHVDGADPDLSIEENPGSAGKESAMKKFKVRKIKAAESSEHAGKRGVFDGDTLTGLADVEPDADDTKVKAAEEQFALLLADEGFEGQSREEVRAVVAAGVRAQEREANEASRKLLLSECITLNGLDEDKAANYLADGSLKKDDYNAGREGQRRIAKLIGEGKLLPRKAAGALRIFLFDRDLFKDQIEERVPHIPLKPVGASRAPQNAKEDFEAMVAARQKEKNCEYRVALSEISREHPAMASAYRDSVNAQSA